MWLRADELAEGMTTVGGLRVDAVEIRNGLHYVTWNGYSHGPKSRQIQYFPEQEFDMADGPKKARASMAQRVNIVVTSDLSDEEGAESVTFGLDGVTYEIDLTEKEQSALRKALAKYVGAARPVGKKRGSSAKKSTSSGPAAKDVREWARQNDYEVPDRGRIPAEVREAYDAAHAA